MPTLSWYWLIFFGLLVGGETILLPALYFAAAGYLSTWVVMALMIAATVLSDGFWYWVGARAEQWGWIKWLIRPRLKQAAERLSALFRRRALQILFLSKFVYGTRTAAQLLSGVHRVPVWSYLAVNILGVVALGGFYLALMYGAATTLENFEQLASRVHLGLALAAVMAVLVQLIIGQVIKRQWSRS